MLSCINNIEIEENDDWKKVYNKYLFKFCNKDNKAKGIMFSKLLKRLLDQNQIKIQVSKVSTQASSSSNLRPQPRL